MSLTRWLMSSSNLTAAPGDPYWGNAPLSLPMDGTNGASNATFTDSSSNAATISVQYFAGQSIATPFSGAGASVEFWNVGTSGSNMSSLTIPGAAWMAALTGSFTVEGWVYHNGTGVVLWDNYSTPAHGGNATGAVFSVGANGAVGAYNSVSSGGFFLNGTAGDVPVGVWTHVAFVRNGGTNMTAYVNGVSKATGTASFALGTNQTAYIGGYWAAGTWTYDWKLASLRVTNTAVYTTGFTPPTSPLTAITGTQFLLNITTPVPVQDVSAFQQGVTTFSPMALATATSRFGGASLYNPTDNSATAQASVPVNSTNNPTLGDYVLEGWVYVAAAPGGTRTLLSWGNNAGGFCWAGLTINSSGVLTFLMSVLAQTSYAVNATATAPLGCMAWVTFERSGGYLFCTLNGRLVSSATATSSTAYTGIITQNYIGGGGSSLSNAPSAYWDSWRFTAGTSRYGDPSASIVTNAPSFTPPTAVFPTSYPTDPFWNGNAVGSVSLLAQFSANINDASTNAANGTAGGSATVSAPTIACPTGQANALSLNGSTQYVSFPALAAFAQTGNFSWETYIFPTSFAAQATSLDQFVATTTGAGNWKVSVTTGGAIIWNYDGSSSFTSTRLVQLNVWNHVKVYRIGSTLYIAINGFQDATTGTFSGTIGRNSTIYVGASQGSSAWFTGSIAAVRLTNAAIRDTNVGSIGALLPTTVAADNLQPIVVWHSLYSSDLSDSSSNAATATAVASAAVAAPVVALPNGASNALSLNGTTKYVTYPASAYWAATGDLTGEIVVEWTSAALGTICGQYVAVTTGAGNWKISVAATGAISWFYDGSSTITSATGVIATGKCYNIVWTRVGSALTLYVNGVSVTTGTFSGTIGRNSVFNVGSDPGGANFWPGDISDGRLTYGAARYPALPVPTAAFPTRWVDPYWPYVTLHAQLYSGYTDSSTQAQTITNVGGSIVSSAPSPKFGAGSWQNATRNTTNKISFANIAANTIGAENWTMRFWYYPGAYGSGNEYVLMWNLDGSGFAALLVYRSSSSNLVVDVKKDSGTSVISGFVIGSVTTAWHEVEICRIGGTVYAYFDGALVTSGSVTGSFSFTSPTNQFGAGNGVYNATQMNLQNIQFTKGVGRNLTNFQTSLLAYPTSAT